MEHSGDRGGPGGVTGVVLVARFLSELALVVGAFWADLAVSVLLAVVVPLLVLVVWGLFVAPRAPYRWPEPARLLLEVALFAGVASALVVERHWAYGLALAVAGIGSALAVRRVAPGS